MKFKAKKKSLSLIKKKKIKKGSSISETEKFLLQQRALVLLSDKKKSVREVARTLETTLPTIKAFFEDENFVEELNSRIEYIEEVDDEFCLDQSKISLSQLYDSFRKRISNDELDDIPLKDLHKMIVETQREFRLDSPGSVTQKIGLVDLTSLQGRYNDSLSGKIRKRKIEKLKKLKSGDSCVEDKEKRSSGRA